MPRSTRVRPDLIPQVKSALKRNGFLRQQDLVDEVGLANSTVRNFLNGKAVDHATFVEICHKLNLESQDIADLGEIIDTPDLAEHEKAIAKPHQESVETDPGSIEARYFRATSNFDSLEPLERKSRIQVLEEIARDSPRYHWKVIEFLADFVRRKAPRKEEDEWEEERSPKLPDDIQAALTVIGGRDPNNKNGSLDLSNTNIRRAYLPDANLQRVNLQKACLKQAILREAHLDGATLDEAHLEQVDLMGAYLEGASLERTYLEQAIFNGAYLKGAKFYRAHLKRVHFDDADLERVEFVGACLEYATLIEANLEDADLRGANLTNATLRRVSLRGANFEGAILHKAHLEETDVTVAKNLEASQIETAYGDSPNSLPQIFRSSEDWNLGK
jgi:uncharacterized protein YjbI with pentapeptide repeats/DNA-binding Xre family transcriptional regulator